tara:strand:- start:24153 stop:24602 length:450 start_codon:yes stop_codon:yes gene_type:complete
MFTKLRLAFREAIENFKEEINRDVTTDTENSLIGAMKLEIANTQDEIEHLESAIKKTLGNTKSEKYREKTCRRREKMALEIGDEETARIAKQYAEKHEYKQGVLKQKSLALKNELEMRRGEYQQMIEAIEIAKKSSENHPNDYQNGVET